MGWMSNSERSCDNPRLKIKNQKSKIQNVKYIVVLVTCPTQTVARRIASHLIRHHLAACVNLLPGVESVFWWKGRVDRCRESLLVIKTTTARLKRLKQSVISLHPYDVPEVIALPLAAGHQPYLRWIDSSTSPRNLS